MRYPEGPKERLVLSELGERFKTVCTSQRTDFKWLGVDLCMSRKPAPKGQELPQVRDSSSIVEIVRKLMPNLVDAMQESFGVVCLDSRNRVVAFAVPFTGGVASAPVEVATMLKVPLLVPTCTGIIIFHNHPSGEPSASQDDVTVTEQIRKACGIVGLRLLDHVILAARGTFSFADAGLLGRP